MTRFLQTTLLSMCILLSQNALAKTDYVLTVTSDYLFRGITQTDHSPALQWGAYINNGNAYGSVWFSNEDTPAGAEGLPVEMDVRFGYNHVFKRFNIDTEVLTYNTLYDTGAEETEFKIGTSFSKHTHFNVYRGIKLKSWFSELTLRHYLDKRVFLDSRFGLWMFDEQSDDALHGRMILGMTFPEFKGLDIFAGFDFISDENPGNSNSDDDENLSFVFGLNKRF